MNDRDQKVLESYLSTLDRALARLNTSDRAEIVTEIKGHVLDATEREPARGVDSVLAALGEAETVANKYLLERGMSPGKASSTPIIKWLTIGFLGTLGMCLLALILMGIFFSPLVEVDERAGRVRLLGGIISINEDVDEADLRGERELAAHKKFRFVFADGKVEVKNARTQKLTWKCEHTGKATPNESEDEQRFVLDMAHVSGLNCEISVPPVRMVEIEGSSGQVEVDGPQVHTAVIMMNGKISFELEDGRDYEQNFRLARGMTHGFPASVPGGIKLEVDLSNGMIEAD